MLPADFKQQLKLVQSLIQDMDIGPDRTRVGLGVYSENFQNHIPLDNNYDKVTLLREIAKAPNHRGELTHISKAIQGINQVFQSTVARTDAPHIALIITDGQSLDPSKTFENATIAKQNGIYFFVVGIGRSVNLGELREISSDPKRDFLHQIDFFRELRDLKQPLSSNMAKVKLYRNDKGTCGENDMVDTLFVYDEFALGASTVDAVRKFLSTIADDMRMNPGNVRLGIVSKTSPGGHNIQLGDYVTREEFKQALDQEDNGPGLPHLLRIAQEEYFDTEIGHRIDARKRIVVILNSPINPKEELGVKHHLFRAKMLKAIEVFIIRLGSDYDKDFLGNLASTPQHVLYVDIEQAKEPFLKLFCKDI
ncbi:collagen alpha-1(xii) chain [Plakobranchus ocellatus]|uniref:Collagen alpha-1(Xii) chain n=1 Tax=Plakobranchus ocellatus TaxID=259542 RepID=A0AAV4DVW2_9GAST|nr:collagen alpha-1(xii) chain [Plakobranchus ocellatus]